MRGAPVSGHRHFSQFGGIRLSAGANEISHKRNPPRTNFAVPISFFKSISIIFGGAGLIFEGFTNRGGCGNEEFCQGLPGVNPQQAVDQTLT